MVQTIIATNSDLRDTSWLGIIVETIEEKTPNLDVVDALRKAAKDFVGTEKGQATLKETCGYFNWGDLVQYLPAEVCERHGVRIVNTFQTDLVVMHDEILIND